MELLNAIIQALLNVESYDMNTGDIRQSYATDMKLIGMLPEIEYSIDVGKKIKLMGLKNRGIRRAKSGIVATGCMVQKMDWNSIGILTVNCRTK